MAIYLIAAIAFALAVAGAGYKGYGLGADHIRAEYAIAEAEARQKADATRQAEQDSARKLAQNLQTALTKQKGLTRELGTSLAKHIAALPPRPAGCPPERLTDELLGDVNRALQGAGNAAGGVVPATGKPPAAVDGPKPDGTAKPAGDGR